MRSRRAPNERWSAKSSVQFYDGLGEVLDRKDVHRAVKAIVRWRVDGNDRKAILRPPGLEGKVDDLQYLLLWAYRRNSVPDERGRPQPSKLLPITVLEATQPAEGNESAASAGPKSLPEARSADGLSTVADLVEWQRRRNRNTKSKRGKDRSDKTIGTYESALSFISETLVYPADDPRLNHIATEPGDSLLLDPVHGLQTSDLFRLLDIRASTNLTTRAANERRVAKWAKSVEKELQRAERVGEAPDLPPPPTLNAERASARTIKETARALKQCLTQARQRELIAYQPWTPEVDDAIPHVSQPHVSVGGEPIFAALAKAKSEDDLRPVQFVIDAWCLSSRFGTHERIEEAIEAAASVGDEVPGYTAAEIGELLGVA